MRNNDEANENNANRLYKCNRCNKETTIAFQQNNTRIKVNCNCRIQIIKPVEFIQYYKEVQKNIITKIFIGFLIIILVPLLIAYIFQKLYNENLFLFLLTYFKKFIPFHINSKESKKSIYVGIDFGSTNSGYTFIKNNQTYHEQIPSKIVIDKEYSRGVWFGNEINRENICNKEKMKRKLYFSYFKRKFEQKGKTPVESEIPLNGEIDLEVLVKEFFELMKTVIIKKTEANLEDMKIVITIPAHFGEEGKKFMKLVTKNIFMNVEIALEQEAASLAIFQSDKIKKDILGPNTNYILIDIGGYTTDIAACRIIDKNNNLELLYTKSFPNGDHDINEGLIDILTKIIGEDKIKTAKEDRCYDWLTILSTIEEKKKEVENNDNESFRILYKDSFGTNLCSMWSQSSICEGVYNGTKVTYNNKEIFIPVSLFKNIIYRIIDNSYKEINELFRKMQLNVKLIIITGGFSQNKIFRERFKKYFDDDDKTIVFLDDPEMTVARGAAYFAKNPNQILYRVSRITIGVFSQESNSSKFIKFIEKGKSIKTDKIIKHIVKPDDNHIQIYYTYKDTLEKENMRFLGDVFIPENQIPLANRTITVYMKFGVSLRVFVNDKDVMLPEDKWIPFFYPS